MGVSIQPECLLLVKWHLKTPYIKKVLMESMICTRNVMQCAYNVQYLNYYRTLQLFPTNPHRHAIP
jgi:C4-type Zn-finger protein